MCRFSRLAGCSGILYLIVTTAAILLPNHSAKLCIAPGSHIAIEEMDFECCPLHDPSDHAIPHSQSHMEALSGCGYCTDIMIVFFGPETALASPCATGIPACEAFPVISTPESSVSVPRQKPAGNKAANAAFSLLPLLC